MLEAEAGMTYIYELNECEKNGKAKKIGVKKEYNITEKQLNELIRLR